MLSPLLTVVIPVYNVEKYLRECLDSIIKQTYTNLEIIIVNDCSPDNSEEIILEYQAKDPRIKYIKHEKNLFQGGARNTGITNATGEWITFIDSDDYIDLDTYEYMMDLILKNNVDLGVFSIIHFDDDTKKEYSEYWCEVDIPTPIKLSNENFTILKSGVAWDKIFRLSDIIDNNITFPEHLKFEDIEFWWKYSAFIEPTIIGSSKKFYHYRQREGSTMDNQHMYYEYYISIFENIYKFLIEKNIFDKYQEHYFLRVRGNLLVFNMPNETLIKTLSHARDFLQQFSDKDLAPYPELFAIKNLPINEYSLEFLKELRKLPNDKWYRFGQLSRTQKIKFIIKTTIKKILKKLHLFEFVKSIKHRLGA